MLTGLLQIAYNTADVIVVGRFVGKEALAAVGSTGSLVNLFLNVFLGLSMGAGVMTARHIGEQDEKTVHECVHTAMLMSVFCGIGIGIIGYFGSGFMLRLMKVPDDVIELAVGGCKQFLAVQSIDIEVIIGRESHAATNNTQIAFALDIGNEFGSHSRRDVIQPIACSVATAVDIFGVAFEQDFALALDEFVRRECYATAVEGINLRAIDVGILDDLSALRRGVVFAIGH